jgi:hypothetical protein
MGGFWNDFADGFSMPFKWGYEKLKKADKVVDKSLDGAGSIAEGISNILSGNSNILLYLGLGVVAVGTAFIVIPKLVDKVI